MPAAIVYLLENLHFLPFFVADSVPGSIIISKGDNFMKDEPVNKKLLIITISLFIGCCVLGVYSYLTQKEITKYRHLSRYHMVCHFAEYYKNLGEKLDVSILASRAPLTFNQPYRAFCTCPLEKEVELDAELQNSEQTLELQFADFHGYICPDLELTITKRPATEKETSRNPNDFVVYEISLDIVGFRTPTPEEQQRVLNSSIRP